MFELESSIAGRRRLMLAAGIRSPDPLDELEGHLRDDIEQRMASGQGDAAAFEAAVQNLGVPGDIEREFQRTQTNDTMKANLVNLLTLIAILFMGVGFALPAVAKLRATGSLPGGDIALLTIGSALVLASAVGGALGVSAFLKQRNKA